MEEKERKITIELIGGLGNELCSLALGYHWCEKLNIAEENRFFSVNSNTLNCYKEWGGHELTWNENRNKENYQNLPTKLVELFPNLKFKCLLDYYPHIGQLYLYNVPDKNVLNDEYCKIYFSDYFSSNIPLKTSAKNEKEIDFEYLEKSKYRHFFLVHNWFNNKFFEQSLDKIRNELFYFSPQVFDYCKNSFPKFFQKDEKVKNIGLHFRISNKTDSFNGYQIKPKYYEKSIAKFLEFFKCETNDLNIWIFTDNKEEFLKSYYPQLFKNETSFHFIEIVSDVHYVELLLMKHCDALSIAVSTLSWWGAVLGEKSDRPIIYLENELKYFCGRYCYSFSSWFGLDEN